jgi:hypothetical protein
MAFSRAISHSVCGLLSLIFRGGSVRMTPISYDTSSVRSTDSAGSTPAQSPAGPRAANKWAAPDDWKSNGVRHAYLIFTYLLRSNAGRCRQYAMPETGACSAFTSYTAVYLHNRQINLRNKMQLEVGSIGRNGSSDRSHVWRFLPFLVNKRKKV